MRWKILRYPRNEIIPDHFLPAKINGISQNHNLGYAIRFAKIKVSSSAGKQVLHLSF